MRIVPLNDTVVIKPEEAPDKTEGGILLPEKRDKDLATKGVVVAVGPGKREENGEFVKTSLKAGMVVAFHGYPTGLWLEEDKVKYKLIPEKQVMAVLAGK
jgi:chaperonin GroES